MTAGCKKTLCMLQQAQWRHAGGQCMPFVTSASLQTRYSTCWHTKVSRSTHIRHRIYRHLKDKKKSGDSNDKLSTCNSVMTWYIVLKRDNTSMNHWRILVRMVGTAGGYRKSSFTSSVPSLHRHLHEINIESSSIVQGNNSKNNNNRKCKFDHTQS